MSLTLPSATSPAAPALADQLLALRRRWRLILAVTLAVPGLALAVMLLSPATYTATGIVLYDPAGAAIPGDSNNLPQDEANTDAVTASQAEIITSLPAAAQIAQQLHFAALPEFNPALRKYGPFARLLGYGKPATPAKLAAAAQQALDASVRPGSRILSVSFSSRSPQLAAAAANLAMQLYLNHERDQSFAALTDAQNWLETHSANVQSALNKTEAALAQARARAGVVQGAQASLTTETVSHLADALVQAQADMAMNQARLNAAGGDAAAAANAAIAPNLLPLRQKQADLAAQVQGLAGQYGPHYPALAAARSQLAALNQEIAAEAGRELDAARADLAADAAQIATLQTALNKARAQEQSEDADSAPIRALEQRAAAGQDMLRAMTQQAGQLAQDASLTRPDARILSSAAVPGDPGTPHRALILLAALLLGLCAGLLLAALRDALDTSLRSGMETASLTGLPCFAMVPEVKSPYLAALDAPFSLYAEQLRALRTGLGIYGGACRIIAITAARPGEGKTTLSIALARALASAGLRVLAIDGDIRQPGFDTLFCTGGARGLTDHLAGLAALEDILITDVPTGARILPAGTQAKSALSLFLSNALPDCLDRLRADYDVILIDAPPAFALAEGRVLARLADCAVLCIRWGATPRRVVRAAILLLREAGVMPGGTVLTRVNAITHQKSGFADAEIYHPRYGGYFKR